MYIRVQLLEKMSNLRSDRLVIPLYNGGVVEITSKAMIYIVF